MSAGPLFSGVVCQLKSALLTILKPGDFYEDCAYHPCLCIGTDMGMVEGISLVDGSFPRQCGIPQCGVRKLTFEEAVIWRMRGPPDIAPEIEMTEAQKYWLKDEK